MKKKNHKKNLIVITILIILVLSIYYAEGDRIKYLKTEIGSHSSELATEQNELDAKIDNLNLIRGVYQENISEFNELKTGDKYHLHDPIYEEVLNFIERDDSSSAREMIDSAKSQGIRCAYVLVYAGSFGSYPIVGFNTIENGMVYFEDGTDYQVIPEIGKTYTSCVVGNPYLPSYTSITDILAIW